MASDGDGLPRTALHAGVALFARERLSPGALCALAVLDQLAPANGATFRCSRARLARLAHVNGNRVPEYTDELQRALGRSRFSVGRSQRSAATYWLLRGSPGTSGVPAVFAPGDLVPQEYQMGTDLVPQEYQSGTPGVTHSPTSGDPPGPGVANAPPPAPPGASAGPPTGLRPEPPAASPAAPRDAGGGDGGAVTGAPGAPGRIGGPDPDSGHPLPEPRGGPPGVPVGSLMADFQRRIARLRALEAERDAAGGAHGQPAGAAVDAAR